MNIRADAGARPPDDVYLRLAARGRALELHVGQGAGVGSKSDDAMEVVRTRFLGFRAGRAGSRVAVFAQAVLLLERQAGVVLEHKQVCGIAAGWREADDIDAESGAVR